MQTTPLLLSRVAGISHLHYSWKVLNKTNPSSYGSSGERIRDFQVNLDTNIEHISKSLLEQTYRFRPNRPKLIPKDNGGVRPLQIPEVRDRLVLKAIALIIEPYLQTVLAAGSGISFAYQKNLGVKDALKKIVYHYNDGNRWILEADIIDFFGTVQRSEILKTVFGHLPDESICGLITAGMSQGVTSLRHIEPEHRNKFSDKGGIPQGNPLSPLLSNVYLTAFDKQMTDWGYKLVRYADDFVVLASSHNQAEEIHAKVKQFLSEKLQLQMHELSTDSNGKTRIVNPRKAIFSFLSITFDGKNLFPSEKNKERLFDKISNICSYNKDYNVLKTLNRVRNIHDGWISTHSFTNLTRYFRQVDEVINSNLYRYLRACGWKFQKSSLGKVSVRSKKSIRQIRNSGQCLSKDQRRNSGIDESALIYKRRTGG